MCPAIHHRSFPSLRREIPHREMAEDAGHREGIQEILTEAYTACEEQPFSLDAMLNFRLTAISREGLPSRINS